MGRTRLTLAAIQMASEVGNPAANMHRAEQLLGKIRTRPALAVLPELAISGYAFKSESAIRPFLEDPETGRTTEWARKMAKKYDLHICVGYPELAPTGLDGIAYNAANLISSSGKVLMHYRKTHMYESDREWGCMPSPEGFRAAGPWPELPLKIQIGICMDLNPWEFKASWYAFEFAKSVAHNKPDLILCPMAWLATEPSKASTIDNKLVVYWQMRTQADVPCVFVNQTNIAGEDVYGGSSTICANDEVSSIAEEGVLEKTVDFP